MSNSREIYMNIKKFVQTRIKSVKSMDEINLNFDLENISFLFIESDYERLSLLKKILQVTINLYNNYEDYKNYQVKFRTRNMEELTPVYRYCGYLSDTDKLECICRPHEDDVVEALFNYMLCFLSLQIKDDSDHEEIRFAHCVLCEYPITNDGRACEVCGFEVSDMQRFSNLSIFKNNKKLTNTLDDESTFISNGIHTIEIQNKKEVNGWNCCKCQNMYRNDIIPSILDSECTYERTKYICEHCVNNIIKIPSDDRKKEMLNDQHKKDEYDMSNDEIVEDVAKEYERTEEGDTWKCSSCKLKNSYKLYSCSSCKSIVIEKGRWICKMCTFENVFINSKCEACFTENDKAVYKFCETCKKIQVDKNKKFCDDCLKFPIESKCDVRWMCKFRNCRKWSGCDVEYCNNCGLWMHNSANSIKFGKPVKILKRGVEVSMWVCNQCYAFTDITREFCSNHFCKSRRKF